MRKLAFLAVTFILAACTSTAVEPTLEVARAPGVPGVEGELEHIQDRIEQARDDGFLTRRQAKLLKRENEMIGDMAERFARDGLLSDAEARELEDRSLYLRDAVLAPGQQSDPGRAEPRLP